MAALAVGADHGLSPEVVLSVLLSQDLDRDHFEPRS
jgi:hypothetical protein